MPERHTSTKPAAPSGSKARTRSVTLKDVAKEAGVSLATASFVLSGRGGAQSSGSALTKEKVRAAAKKLGYSPNRYAQAMRTGKTKAIILALGSGTINWSDELVAGVRDSARPHALSTLVLADDTWFDFLSGYGSDAAFVTGIDFYPDAKARVEDLHRSGVHLVVLSELLDPEHCDVIFCDSQQAAVDAFTRLRARHERVSMLTRSRETDRPSEYRSRTLAFREAVRRAGDPLDDSVLLPVGSAAADAYQRCIEILSAENRPTAIVTQTPRLAHQLCRAADALGIRCPEDLEIISLGMVTSELDPSINVSFYGVVDYVDQIADIVVNRALNGSDAPFEKYHFTWQFHAGATTREAQESQARTVGATLSK